MVAHSGDGLDGKERPRRLADIDWNRTFRANLRHYRPKLETVITETLIG